MRSRASSTSGASAVHALTKDPITQQLREHYARTFEEHGATVRGVDWGTDDGRLRLRYEKMAAVIEPGPGPEPTLLDVGCGFGGLFEYLRSAGTAVAYTGIDVVAEMVEHAAQAFPEAAFLCCDVFAYAPPNPFDYVVCNGILTQKLDASTAAMDVYAERLIKTMFILCRRGIAFNVMSTHVNYTVDNLYYRDPAELLAWCLENVTTRARLDHLYPPLHEYSLYLYREAQAS
jgi:2-polyprenyl-3-methyl-5-hydroxy-6-metoxy-1,4-benzoquinol methylase